MNARMFYVYSGYVNADNYDCSESPVYTVNEFRTSQEVMNFKKKFDEGVYDECANIVFRVFEGKELKLRPKHVVTEYELL